MRPIQITQDNFAFLLVTKVLVEPLQGFTSAVAH